MTLAAHPHMLTHTHTHVLLTSRVPLRTFEHGNTSHTLPSVHSVLKATLNEELSVEPQLIIVFIIS